MNRITKTKIFEEQSKLRELGNTRGVPVVSSFNCEKLKQRQKHRKKIDKNYDFQMAYKKLMTKKNAI